MGIEGGFAVLCSGERDEWNLGRSVNRWIAVVGTSAGSREEQARAPPVIEAERRPHAKHMTACRPDRARAAFWGELTVLGPMLTSLALRRNGTREHAAEHPNYCKPLRRESSYQSHPS